MLKALAFPNSLLSRRRRPLTFNNTTKVISHTLAFFMIICGGCVVDARSKILMSETMLELAVALRKLCVKRETSNLSEVCSGSDCHDNNMGSLTKWDKNPAQVCPLPVRVFLYDENNELLEKENNMVVHLEFMCWCLFMR